MMDENERGDRAVSAKQVFRAAQAIASRIRSTPLEPSETLSRVLGADVRLKLENLQATGSFKFRGAVNVMANLSESQRASGVIAPTAGNHGLALAHAGRAAGVPVTICLPETADPAKIAAMRANGALVELFGDVEQARRAARKMALESGATYVSAYNNPCMIAGGGTVGLEILSEWIDAEVILVGIGGGGLAAGVATVAKAIVPGIEVWGIQTEASPTFIRWREAGAPVAVELSASIAEGISGPIEPETMTWPIVRDRLDRVLPVSDAEIAAAMGWMLDHHRQVVEPSGVAAVAGIMRYADLLAGRKVAAIVTGGNISGPRYRALIGDGSANLPRNTLNMGMQA